jgi:Kdo2-lipid IVA lauroyltransferase/acyltransferase
MPPTIVDSRGTDYRGRMRLFPALHCKYALAGAGAFLVYRVLGLRRGVIRENIARSFPELSPAERRTIVRDHARHQGELLAESWYGLEIEADELRERVTITNPELLRASSRPNRPVVLAGAHQANWEWMSLRLSLEFGSDYLAMYKPPRNARLEPVLVRLRTRFGGRLTPAKSILKELANFRRAAAIAMLADQAPRGSPERHWTRFLNQDTAFFMGAELLGRALRTQVLFVSMRRIERGRYVIALESLNNPAEKVEQGAISERYARALERTIRSNPPDWLWSHRRWKLRRPSA